MRNTNQFDEVMIVNPGPAGGDPATGERIMFGYYGYPPGYGSPYDYADEPYQVGYAADEEDALGCPGRPSCACGRSAPLNGYYADPYGLAWAGYGIPQPPPGYGYGFAAPAYGYGEPFGYPAPYGFAVPGGFGQAYEMEGYDDGDEYGGYDGFADEEQYADAQDELGADETGWFGSDDFDVYGGVDGYVRDEASGFNYTVPGSLSGYAEEDGIEGYMPPRPISPTVTGFTPPPGADGELPDTLRPLW
jgi:hypothetical protein